eukprot:6727337-Heterocapsa_arctica.AAC.1
MKYEQHGIMQTIQVTRKGCLKEAGDIDGNRLRSMLRLCINENMSWQTLNTTFCSSRMRKRIRKLAKGVSPKA